MDHHYLENVDWDRVVDTNDEVPLLPVDSEDQWKTMRHFLKAERFNAGLI